MEWTERGGQRCDKGGAEGKRDHFEMGLVGRGGWLSRSMGGKTEDAMVGRVYRTK